MKFDRDLLKTILFSLGVVSFIIGVYETIVTGDIFKNYWIFMISMGCWLPLRYWRQKEAAEAKAAQAREVSVKAAPTRPGREAGTNAAPAGRKSSRRRR